MKPSEYRQPPGSLRAGWVVAISLLVAVAAVAALWALGVVDVSRVFAPVAPSREGLVAVPVPARAIPAYTRVTRDHFWNPETQQLTSLYLPPDSVTPAMMTRAADIFGRVLNHDKPAGFVFTEADFLPKGTREGLTGGIPTGKRAVRVEAEQVQGLYGLRSGDRFDLVATLAIDSRSGRTAFDAGGAYSAQFALQAQLSNWQKQATVRVLVQNGVIVEPLLTRQVPVFSRSLTQGAITRMRPVQEAVLAVDPDEVARLTEAIAVEAKVSVVPRSGRPDEPANSITPDLTPVSPFVGFAGAVPAAAPGLTPGASPTAGGPFRVVERITGGERTLTTIPNR